ncbi:MAG TPA: glycosyltransferase 87 family protein [Acidimicrobiales bacterium]|nr:glycosyltransferase 87 family protein [Acidimicrobiales bacterium]
MLATVSRTRLRFMTWWTSLNALTGDGLLYLLAAGFALVLGESSTQAAQWQWGYLAMGPYALAALLSFVLARYVVRRQHLVRVVLFSVVVVGAIAAPLGLEAHWRHAQPEVGVIARAGELISKGQDPYHTYDEHGRLVGAIKDLPKFESFFPYFPLMGAFGLPSAETHKGKGLTDARIIMTLMSIIVSGWALALLRASKEQKLRVAQVLIALPTGALFFATGGDDMPILALMLLAVAALQRRQSNLAGISLGLAAAMKITAWPMAAGALLVARDREGRSTWKRVLAWVATIVIVTTVPFAVRAPNAFMANVFAFPLGLAGVSSPAASALPGHILTSWMPILGHILAPVSFVIGGYFATKYIRRHWPLALSQILGLLAIVFLGLICVASATRVGYVIYPLNLLLWSSVTKEAPVPAEELVAVA